MSFQKNTLSKRRHIENPQRSRPMRQYDLKENISLSFTGQQAGETVNLFAISFTTKAEEMRLEITQDKAQWLVDYFSECLAKCKPITNPKIPF